MYDNSIYEKEVKTSFPNIILDASQTDMLFLESIQNVNPQQLFSNYNLHNDSLIVLNNINRDKSSMASWLDFIKSKKVAVSIDMYYCGVIFIRKEQRKEHFTIRI